MFGFGVPSAGGFAKSVLLLRHGGNIVLPAAGLHDWKIPPQFKDIQYPERNKLKIVDKVPTFPANLKPPKSQKRLILMRGPELLHNKLIHEQYGIVATSPGRLRYGHFEMLRLTIGRKMDPSRMFAEWRIDPPWQPVTRKGQGKRMGGGKGPIDHYVTPIKHGRVIIEMGGHCEFAEIKPILKEVIGKLPFKAIAVTKESLAKMEAEKIRKEKANLNPYTFKYCILNNLGSCQNWISTHDRKWFGEHI